MCFTFIKLSQMKGNSVHTYDLPIFKVTISVKGSQYEPNTSERRSMNERNAQTSRPKVHWTKMYISIQCGISARNVWNIMYEQLLQGRDSGAGASLE
jgi:hypothetical protein